MCWQCDHPEATYDDYLEFLDGLMAERGWMVQSVEGTRLHAPFAYTVGLTPMGLPELLVTGLGHRESCELLNHVADYTVTTNLILPGERMDAGRWQLEAVHVEHPDAHLFTAIELYGPAVRALQLARVDAHGRWPWDEGHVGQPVFGVRATRYCDAHKPPVPQGW